MKIEEKSTFSTTQGTIICPIDYVIDFCLLPVRCGI